MPGKVNPVMPEVVNLVAFRVMGNDDAVTLAAHSGQLQLNAYEPLEGLAMHRVAAPALQRLKAFRTKCVDGITVNEKVLAHYMETTVGIVTALIRCSATRRPRSWRTKAYKSGKGILEVIREKKVLTESQIKDLLDPIKLTNLDKSKYKKKLKRPYVARKERCMKSRRTFRASLLCWLRSQRFTILAPCASANRTS